MRPNTAPGRPMREMVELQNIREEIEMLHKKFDKELQGMREVIDVNLKEMAKSIETAKTTVETEGKENSAPLSILNGAQQALLDVTRRRWMFETSVTDCERSRAQRVFDILGHFNDEDGDAPRVRALIDDVVNNLDNVHKPVESVIPTAPKSTTRMARLTSTKTAPGRTQKLSNQRPTSPSSTLTTVVKASQDGRPVGLAELVDFSIAKTTSVPLTQRPKPIISINTPSKDPQIEGHVKTVIFERTPSRSKSPPKVKTFASDLDARKVSTFLPLGMRQYSMWPAEKLKMPIEYPSTQAATVATTTTAANPASDSVTKDEALAQVVKKLILSSEPQQYQLTDEAKLTTEEAKTMLENALREHLARPATPATSTSPLSCSHFRDVTVGTHAHGCTKEESLSPIYSPRKFISIDRASSPKPTKVISRGQSVQSVEQPRSLSSPSSASEVIVTSETPQSVQASTQSPIFGDNTAVLAVETSTTKEEVEEEKEEESEDGDSFSSTEPRSFSDGIWLDPDRSEGEASGVVVPGIVEAANLAKELGSLPSTSGISETMTSSSGRSQSEGEFNLDQMNNQLGVWVAPWRDPLLHLIALNAAGKYSKLPWNQQKKIKRIAQIVERRGARQTSDYKKTCSCSAEDLGWVENMAAGFDVNSSSSMRTAGEVILANQQQRRDILAKSSQRMRQHSISFSDDEDTLTRMNGETGTQEEDLLSGVKSFSDEDWEEEEEVIKEQEQEEVFKEEEVEEEMDVGVVYSSSTSNSTYGIDPGASSEPFAGPLEI